MGSSFLMHHKKPKDIRLHNCTTTAQPLWTEWSCRSRIVGVKYEERGIFVQFCIKVNAKKCQNEHIFIELDNPFKGCCLALRAPKIFITDIVAGNI